MKTLSKLGIKQALIDETIALDYEIRDTEYFENDEKIIRERVAKLEKLLQKDERNYIAAQALITIFESKISGDYKKYLDLFVKYTPYEYTKTFSKMMYSLDKGNMSDFEKYMNENGMSKKVNNLNWEFNLIKSEELNAFAMPGGKIAFFTGIMPVLKTDAGVAFVMGHEIGHVIGGHHAEGKSNQMTAGVVMIGKGVVDVLTGGATEIINNDLLGQGLQIGLLKFNRTQEYEADKYGMIFMAMAGYNPEEAIKVQERMAAKGNGSGVDFLSTHPSSDKRIQALKDFLPEAMKYYRK